jgi:hypothetical protein
MGVEMLKRSHGAHEGEFYVAQLALATARYSILAELQNR